MLLAVSSRGSGVDGVDRVDELSSDEVDSVENESRGGMLDNVSVVLMVLK